MSEKAKNTIPLSKLEIYAISRELSRFAWEIYENMHWRDKKILGDQFITSTDSYGANIAEGYGRFHYLDRIKFYYNARGSLLESRHWASVLYERDKITTDQHKAFQSKAETAQKKLQSYISSIYRTKNKKT